jgi:hypothetical protein
MAKSRRPKFTGDLAKPVKWEGPKLRRQSFEETDEEYAIWKGKWEKDTQGADALADASVASKIALLRDRYNLSRSLRGYALALRLLLEVCSEFIPGFRIDDASQKRGRPKKWTPLSYSELWADVEKIKAERAEQKCSDRHACRILIRRACGEGKGRYLPIGRLFNEAAVSSLESRLREARQGKHNQRTADAFTTVCKRFGRMKAVALLIESFGTKGVRQ